MAWRVSPTLNSHCSTESLCSSYKLQQYLGSRHLKCLSLGFRANSHLCQELGHTSCGIIITDCAVTTSVTLENRLESQNHSFWSKNLWRQLHWLTARSFLRCYHNWKLVGFFSPKSMSSGRIAWAPQRADRPVTRCSGFKSVLHQNYLESNRIYIY